MDPNIPFAFVFVVNFLVTVFGLMLITLPIVLLIRLTRTQRSAALKAEAPAQLQRDTMQAVQQQLAEQRKTNRLLAAWIESGRDAP
ncbi:MAG: hypothetical protein JNL73_00120 [Anaerolineales bacterium]|nr:hypothetical protein [Anaerolineales bacterium]